MFFYVCLHLQRVHFPFYVTLPVCNYIWRDPSSMITGGREILQEKNSPWKPVKPKDEKSLNVYVRLRHPSIRIPTCQHSMGTIWPKPLTNLKTAWAAFMARPGHPIPRLSSPPKKNLGKWNYTPQPEICHENFEEKPIPKLCATSLLTRFLDCSFCQEKSPQFLKLLSC